MSGFLKLIGTYVLSVGACALWAGSSDAATPGRVAYSGARANMYGAGAARMPSSPTLPINSVGNMGGSIYNNKNTSISNPVPDPEPEQTEECGTYTVEDCMTMIASCVNNGALPNGINDLFDEEVRNAIINGMGLCSAQVDMCIDQVEIKTENGQCQSIYNTAADVWIDFNSRRVQPEYYNFVLRKTGLTPNQAENTCWLLDRNVYGTSFTALNEDNYTDGKPQWQVTNEYGKSVASYNNQANPIDGEYDYKTKPAGLDVNSDGFYDAQRGHYARWDAKTATCLVRVAAYNKDKHITNEWLFGAVGDERPAEVWRAAGETFTCDKDLFGFSLMKNTATVAVVGVGGGTVLGAAVGAGVGARYEFKCNLPHQQQKLRDALSSDKIQLLNRFVAQAVNEKDDKGKDKVVKTKFDLPVTGAKITQTQCDDIVNLFDKYLDYKVEYDLCTGNVTAEEIRVAIALDGCADVTTVNDCMSKLSDNDPYKKYFDYCKPKPEGTIEHEKLYVDYTAADKLAQCLQHIATKVIPTLEKAKNCEFHNLLADGADVLCSPEAQKEGDCVSKASMKEQLDLLDKVFDSEMQDLLNGKEANFGKAIGVGAAVGAGAGGLATAITALVEQGNISCRIGDGLGQVGLNKTHKIDTLKDFYVKWNLRLPDAIAPAKAVTSYSELESVCKMYGQNDCDDVRVNVKAGSKIETVYTICQFNTTQGQCLVNDTVATSHGLVPPASK